MLNRNSREHHLLATLDAAVAVLLILGGCAETPTDPVALAAQEEANDPAEPLNRVIFDGNQWIDRNALQPTARFYQDTIPDGVRDAAIRALKVETASGSMVPLSGIAEIDVSEGPSSIRRFDRHRVVALGANLPAGVALETASERFRALAVEAGLPATVAFLESGDVEVQAEAQQSFADVMVLALMLAILILLFRTVVQPFTILFSLPLEIGGVAAGLILTGNALSMPVLIGILMLMGVVSKNAILLVDFGLEAVRAGMDRTAAIIEAGRKRTRPIVMTSIAMSAGMVPSALGVGEGGGFRAPMAIAVIGGIIVSTVLSLVVVPSVFLIMHDLSRLLRRVFGGWIGKREAHDPIDRTAGS